MVYLFCIAASLYLKEDEFDPETSNRVAGLRDWLLI
jgi:hypothetical protein